MLSEFTLGPRRRQPPFVRDENYWNSLLDLAESAEPEQLPQPDGDADSYFSSLTQKSAENNLWRVAAEALECDELFDLEVISFNKGGLLVNWRGLTGFVPASHLIDVPQTSDLDRRYQVLGERVGSLIHVRLIEVSQQEDRLIFSERAAQVDGSTRQNLWDHIELGAILEGVITNLTDFGAFVDLGGIEGLIHISELSWSRLKHPSDIVAVGQTIKVKVLQIDRSRKRVALSYKQMRVDPWYNIEERYRPDQLVEGTIREVVQYGAFVTLEDELEGLIHVSEFDDDENRNLQEAVSAGQFVVARVLHVNARNRRIGLSLRDVIPSAENDR